MAVNNVKEIEDLVKIVSKLPGLGPKSAKRIVLKLINNREELIKPLTNTLAQVYKNVIRCKICGNLKSLKRSIKKNTAAIMIETIMGEGGIKVHSNAFLKKLRKICNQKKILLILDEVQCGIGRTGKFFAFEYAKIKPDIVPIAKGIGGGFPLGAVLMTKKVATGMVPGTHGTTNGGNPLAMSVGNSVLDQIFKKGFLKNVQKISKYFHSELKKIQNLVEKIYKFI